MLTDLLRVNHHHTLGLWSLHLDALLDSVFNTMFRILLLYS